MTSRGLTPRVRVGALDAWCINAGWPADMAEDQKQGETDMKHLKRVSVVKAQISDIQATFNDILEDINLLINQIGKKTPTS